MEKGISVVIPNYNGIHLLPHTLPTVEAVLKELSLPSEIIISDDCSTDGSPEYIVQHYPQIRIIRGTENRGFSVTSNRGIGSATYNLVLLLNSDVKLEKNYFDSQLKYFERKDTFGVMGRIIGWEDNEIQDGAKYPSFHTAKIKTSVNYLVCPEEEMRNGLYSMYVSGANALLNRATFLKIGGFNEMFSPFYVEDYELSLRAWRLGYKCYYDHEAVCRHRTSTTIKSKSGKSFIKMISNRNKWFLHAIHLSSGWRILWMIQLLPEVLMQSLFGKPYYLKSFRLFIQNGGKIRQSRKALREMAGTKGLVSVQDVARFIQSSVNGKKIKYF